MGTMKLTRPSIKALAAAGASAAIIASGSAAYAIYDAVSAPTAAPAAPAASAPAGSARLAATGAKANANGNAGARAKARAAALRRLGGLVIGKVDSVHSTGGAASQGTIVVAVPDGKTVTANLVKRTRVLVYQGPGTKATTESVGQLHDNEMVAVRIIRRPAASSGAGSSASGTASAGSNALTLTAASPATGSGTAYAALIVDLGYAAATGS
jgi:hypothetical protein